MDFAVQPNLVERTVFEAARKDDTLRPHYERQYAACYEERQPDQRDRAFAALHDRWFNELGIRDLIAGVVSEFPHFQLRVSRLRVTQAPNRKNQTVELFGLPEKYTVVVAVTPSILLDRPSFEFWARHEFMHIDDMLNPDFGYDLAERPTGSTRAERNLIQDRYAALWAMRVDARLAQHGKATADVKSTRESELIRAFSLVDSETVRGILQSLWEQDRWLSLTHPVLMDWAKLGIPGLRDSVTHPVMSRVPMRGGACPLCRFPTFDWLNDKAELAELHDAVVKDFPAWTLDEPICRRCAEVYRTFANLNSAPSSGPIPFVTSVP